MNRRDDFTDMLLFKVALSVAVICLGVMACIAIVVYVVGERAPSPSPDVPHASRADSEAAPARPLVDGELAGVPSTPPVGTPVGGGGWGLVAVPSPVASTVTTQALVASPSATAYLVIDPAPATPVTTSPAVVTQGAKSDIWGLIAASPWPQYLWGTVACLVERESSGLAWKVGLEGERGLMQVHPVTWSYLAEYGFAPDALFDPATNLRAAWELYLWNEKYKGDGLTPWKSTRGGCA